MTNCRTVVVKELPESVTQSQVPQLRREIAPLVGADWPCVILDFSNVLELDRAGVEMLLRSMEEAVKRNGDVKLACVSPQVTVILELTQVDRLFEVFESLADAMESFRRFPVEAFREKTGLTATGAND